MKAFEVPVSSCGLSCYLLEPPLAPQYDVLYWKFKVKGWGASSIEAGILFLTLARMT